jgi:hypothetical protein
MFFHCLGLGIFQMQVFELEFHNTGIQRKKQLHLIDTSCDLIIRAKESARPFSYLLQLQMIACFLPTLQFTAARETPIHTSHKTGSGFTTAR